MEHNKQQRRDAIAGCKENGVLIILNPYLKANQYVRLPQGVVFQAVIIDASLHAEKLGVSWTLPTRVLRDGFSIAPNKLHAWLNSLEQQQILTSTQGSGREKEWSPQWHMGTDNEPKTRVIRVTEGGDNVRVMQSPLAPVRPSDIPAGTPNADQLCNNFGYTLISYDYGFFTGETDDLNLFVYHGIDREDLNLRKTWMAINDVKVLPHGLDLGGPDFWSVATAQFLHDRNAMADSNAPTPLWRSTPDELWRPMDMVKRAKLFNELCRKVTPEAIREENEKTQPWEPLATAPKSVVTPAPSAAPIIPAERQLVKGEGTPQDFAKYRDEHGHNPIVGNPIESDFARRRAQGEYYRDTKRETPLVIKTVAAARKAFGSGEQIRTGGGYNTTRRPIPPTGAAQQDTVQQRPTTPRMYNRAETPLHMPEGPQPARVFTPRKLDSYALVNDIVRSNMARDTQKFMLDMLIKYGRYELFPQDAETPTTTGE